MDGPGRGHVRSSYEDGPGLGLARREFGAPLPGRPLHALHRRDHRHAQRGHLAPGGHLLRRHGGGGWGAEPITTADELAGRLDPDDAGPVVMLVVAPLMHGNAQWVMWNAFMMAGTAVLYTGTVTTPTSCGGSSATRAWSRWPGRRRHGPAAVRRPGRGPAGTYDISTLAVVGSGGAMLSATVKAELGRSYPTSWSWTGSDPARAGPRVRSRTGPSGPDS